MKREELEFRLADAIAVHAQANAAVLDDETDNEEESDEEFPRTGGPEGDPCQTIAPRHEI